MFILILINIKRTIMMMMMMIIHKINSIPRREEIKKEAQEKSSINFLKEKKRKLMDRE